MEQTIKVKTPLEIIEETAAFYIDDPSRRGIRPGCHDACEYVTINGKHCAVGRVMLEPEKFTGERNNSIDSLEFDGSFVDELKPEYRIDNIIFWLDLQLFHDTPIHWEKDGITQEGKIYLEEIKKKYA